MCEFLQRKGLPDAHGPEKQTPLMWVPRRHGTAAGKHVLLQFTLVITQVHGGFLKRYNDLYMYVRFLKHVA